jgi:predicted NUDIX family phosphoesterase
LLEAITNRATENDFILMDRGVFDTVCWFNFQMQRGAMPKEEYEAFTNFFLNEKWVSIVTLVYVFFARPDVSLKREYATLLTRKPGSVMRDEILRDYNMAIDNCVDEHGALFPRVARLDTSDKNQDQVGYLVTSQVIDILDDVLQEKIGYFETLKIPSLGKSIFEYESFAKSLPRLLFDRRILVEADAVAAQPVAIAVIKDRNEDKVLIGTKTNKTLRTNSPERNKTLFWFGGHVRGEDARSEASDGAPDVEETLREALRREIKEELDLDLAVTAKPRICVWDHSSESGRKHIAFIFVIELDFDSLHFQVDNKEYGINDVKQISFGEYMGSPAMRVDTWSHAILLHILKWKTGPLFEQTEFNFF